jgi:hypothetical protein
MKSTDVLDEFLGKLTIYHCFNHKLSKATDKRLRSTPSDVQRTQKSRFETALASSYRMS